MSTWRLTYVRAGKRYETVVTLAGEHTVLEAMSQLRWALGADRILCLMAV